jgi:hypothetical protein
MWHSTSDLGRPVNRRAQDGLSATLSPCFGDVTPRSPSTACRRGHARLRGSANSAGAARRTSGRTRCRADTRRSEIGCSMIQPTKPKPAYGSPCNHCGLCCIEGVCRTGRLILGEVQAPCPALIKEDDGFYCALMTQPQRFAPTRARIAGAERMRQAAQLLIGAGLGCCSRAEHEPKVARPSRLTRKQWVESFRTWGA